MINQSINWLIADVVELNSQLSGLWHGRRIFLEYELYEVGDRMAAADLKAISDQLNEDEHAALRSEIFQLYLKDAPAGAGKIVEFAKQRGVTVGIDAVMEFIEAMDDDEMDVELTTENLASVAGGEMKT